MSQPPCVAFAMRYPDDVGLVWASMARFYSGSCEKLAGQARAMICFPSLTPQPAFATTWAERVDCDWYDTSSSASRASIRALVAQYNIKLIFYTGCPAQTLDLRFLHRLGLRTINYEVDSYPTTTHQFWPVWLGKRLLRGWLKIGIHDCYVANAHHQREFLLQFAVLPSDRVVTVVNGVDLEQFFPAPSPAPSTLGLPTTEYYVVSVGQARPEKRIDTLIAAAAEIFRQEPGLSSTFVHVGGGQCLESWKKKAAELGLGERFQFPGGQANVVPYLRLATVFAHPAERESFGFAVAEAMACGKPVVAARSPGPAEIVGENGSGTLVEPGDVRGFARELLALLKDESRRQQIGNAGRARVVQYYDSRKQSLDLARVIQTELKKSS